MEAEAMKYLAAAIFALPAFGAALGLGMHFKSYNEALARNPEVKADLDAKYFLSMAFIEALGIIPIVIAMIVLLG